MKLHHAALTDVGLTRDHNEDNYKVADDPRIAQLGHLFVVCDGVGGYQAGEVASEMMSTSVIKSYYEHSGSERARALVEVIEQGNREVFGHMRGNMGTTVVAALLRKGMAYVANVGDSRCYLIRDHQARQITDDHSMVGEQLRAGIMTPEQARRSNIKNIITRAIGSGPTVEVDLFEVPLRDGDLLMLCSDGLHGLVEDQELADIVLDYPPQQAVHELVRLANERGGTDNITVIVISVEEVGAAPAAGGEDQILNALLANEAAASPPTARTAPLPATIRTAPMPVQPPARQALPPSDHPAADPARRPLGKVGLLLAVLLLFLLGGAAVWALQPELFGMGGTAATATPAVTPTRQATVTPMPSATIAATARPTAEAPGSGAGEEEEGDSLIEKGLDIGCDSPLAGQLDCPTATPTPRP